MSAPIGLGPVFKGHPIMKSAVVVHQLDIPRFKGHQEVQARIIGQSVQEVQRLDLTIGQTRRRLESLCRIDVGTVIDGRHSSGKPVEHRNHEERLFPGRNLAAPIGRKRLKQRRGEIRPLPTHLVPQCVGRDQSGFTAPARLLQAEEPHEVA
jgi:hypothetical protein